MSPKQKQRFTLRCLPPLLLAAWPFGACVAAGTAAASDTQPTVTHVPGRLVAANGHKLWVETAGSGEPLLLLAGGPANSHLTFHPYFSGLAGQCQVIYVDYRGRGRSEAVSDPREITFAGDVQDVASLIESLQLGAVNLYGFSYGGLIAQAVALEHPRLVRRLILANTLHSPEMWQKNHENINRELELHYPEVWERIIALRQQGVRSTDARMQELYRVHAKLVRFYNPENAARMLSEPGSRNAALYPVFVGEDVEFFIGGEVAKLPDFRPRLASLRMPLMILAGRYDRALYPKYQYEFRRWAPQAHFVWMERSGSFAHLEEPERVMELVGNFLRTAH